jgi:NhaP-type Na+/H+ or K+/H+ antiporter
VPLQVPLFQAWQDLAWPIAVLVAWVAGEYGHRWMRLPRISAYAVSGFVLALPAVGVLPAVAPEAIRLLASIAFGLVLFEVGYRTNLSWLRANPWLVVTGVVEATATAAVVYLACGAAGMDLASRQVVAALAMASSPAAMLRVVHDRRASGQVTERALHLSVIDCLLAVFALKVVIAGQQSATAESVRQLAGSAMLDLAASGALGILAGMTVPVFLRSIARTRDEGTMAFALAVSVVVGLAHATGLSAVLATLAFGVVARRRRTVLNAQRRGFGTLGQLLSVLLFVYVASAVPWADIAAGATVGILLVLLRLAAKTAAAAAFAVPSGITWQKGALTGIAMTPLSVFVILVLEQTRVDGTAMFELAAPLTAAALVLEVLGPILVGVALRAAREVPDVLED